MQSSRPSRRPTCRIPERQKKENSDWRHRILADTGYTSLFRVNAQVARASMHGSSIRLLAAAFEPYFKHHERLVLVFAAASRQKLGEHTAGKHRQGQARSRCHVAILFEPVNDERLPVVTPDFSHTQRRMKRKLGIV